MHTPVDTVHAADRSPFLRTFGSRHVLFGSDGTFKDSWKVRRTVCSQTAQANTTMLAMFWRVICEHEVMLNMTTKLALLRVQRAAAARPVPHQSLNRRLRRGILKLDA